MDTRKSVSSASVRQSQSNDADSTKSHDRRSSTSTLSSFDSRKGYLTQHPTQHSDHSSSSVRNFAKDFAVERLRRPSLTEKPPSSQNAYVAGTKISPFSPATGSVHRSSSPTLPTIIDLANSTSNAPEGGTRKSVSSPKHQGSNKSRSSIDTGTVPSRGLAIQMQRSEVLKGPFLAGEAQPFRMPDEEGDE